MRFGQRTTLRTPLWPKHRIEDRGRQFPIWSEHSWYVAGRLGPDSLSQRLTAELNLYEGQEEMLRQITDVERIRASALAQQESVAIAQVNKVRQQ